MPERITGQRRSEVYDEFEALFDEKDLSYTPYMSLGLDDSVDLEELGFQRIEGVEKFYTVRAEDEDYEIAVEVGEIDESYGITSIRSTEGNDNLANYLEDYFSVN